MSEHENRPSEPLRDLGGMIPPEELTEPASANGNAPGGAPATEGLDGTVHTLLATVDQHSRELDGLEVQMLAAVFLIGALGGLLWVVHRRLRELEQ